MTPKPMPLYSVYQGDCIVSNHVKALPAIRAAKRISGSHIRCRFFVDSLPQGGTVSEAFKVWPTRGEVHVR
jgi:hypothetical protein